MVVRRNGRQNRVYYHCSRYFRPWADELVWEDLCSILRDDAWVNRQLVNEQSKSDDGAKLLSLVQSRKLRATARIRKVQEGYESGVYTGEEAKRRIADLRAAALKAEEEIGRLQLRAASGSIESTNAEAMKYELQRLLDRNLDEAGFQERLEVITRLGVTIRPAEDLKSIKVECQLAVGDARSSEATMDAGIIEPLKLGGDGERLVGCGKVPFAPPDVSICTNSSAGVSRIRASGTGRAYSMLTFGSSHTIECMKKRSSSRRSFEESTSSTLPRSFT